MAQWAASLATAKRQTPATEPLAASRRECARLDEAVRRRAAGSAAVRSEADHRRHGATGARGADRARAVGAWPAVSAARVALHRVVLARRCTRLRDPLL